MAFGGSPDDAFHLVCPTLPGFGFSGKPAEPGWGVDRIADAWDQLMARLGYPRYGAQGGDWGSLVAAALGRRHPARVLGVHLNMVIAFPDPGTISDLTAREQEALAAAGRHRAQGTGYAAIQSTRPQSVGYGLVDSPAALCAWIMEKFQAWSDCDGDPGTVFSREEMLDNIMLYWLTGSGASAARLYWESYAKRSSDPVGVPVGCSIFPKEIYRPSRRWAEPLFTDLRYWHELDRGGHFAALEQPASVRRRGARGLPVVPGLARLALTARNRIVAIMSGFPGMLTPTPRYYTMLGRAAEIARAAGAGQASADHLFLAMLHDGGWPLSVLTEAGMIDLDQLEDAVLAAMRAAGDPPSAGPAVRGGRVAHDLGDSYIGVEHAFLAIIRDRGTAARWRSRAWPTSTRRRRRCSRPRTRRPGRRTTPCSCPRARNSTSSCARPSSSACPPGPRSVSTPWTGGSGFRSATSTILTRAATSSTRLSARFAGHERGGHGPLSCPVRRGGRCRRRQPRPG